jgi:dolichol-phosphate mannosyltransferase
MLSKYTAAFLVPSGFLYLLGSGRDRRWLATPWPYLAGVCSLLVFAPVLYWNGTHQWASFQFQSIERFQAATGFRLAAALECAGVQWLGILPLAGPLAILAVWRGVRSARPQERFLFWSFAPMVVFFFALYTLGGTSSFHLLWPLPAYLALIVAMAGVLAGPLGWVTRFYRAHLALLAGVWATGMMLALLHAVWVLPGIPPLREVYGWDEVATRSRALNATLPEGSFYLAAGGRSYPSTSQLAFYLGQPLQVHGQHVLGLESLQYRYWVDPQHLAGKDAVVVMPGGDPSSDGQEYLLRYFQAVERADELSVPVGRISPRPGSCLQFTFYLAHGYLATPRSAAQTEQRLPAPGLATKR